MATKIELPIQAKRKPPQLIFPQRCVNCGQPPEDQLNLALQVNYSKNKPLVVKLDLPMCKTCAARERQVTLVTLVPFTVGGLLAGIIAFIPTWLLAPEGSTPQTYMFPYFLGLFVALLVGIPAGSLVEALVKVLAVPFFGSQLYKRPLTALAIFSDTENVLGLQARLTQQRKMIELFFERDDIAQEFLSLNPPMKPGD